MCHDVKLFIKSGIQRAAEFIYYFHIILEINFFNDGHNSIIKRFKRWVLHIALFANCFLLFLYHTWDPFFQYFLLNIIATNCIKVNFLLKKNIKAIGFLCALSLSTKDTWINLCPQKPSNGECCYGRLDSRIQYASFPPCFIIY